MAVQDTLQRYRLIHSDPEIMSGMPVFIGTRVPIQTFFDYLEGENGLAEFVEDFPYLQSQAIQVLEIIAKTLIEQERNASAGST
ncbi:DUF433 domain-containing protein [Leptolyngbya sp. AN03gr2]|uniref:DUF433 domain-containing protein n=1 Tax=unclassified Leptolyngbya TaxID=2650499 RepID=UPI003D319511